MVPMLYYVMTCFAVLHSDASASEDCSSNAPVANAIPVSLLQRQYSLKTDAVQAEGTTKNKLTSVDAKALLEKHMRKTTMTRKSIHPEANGGKARARARGGEESMKKKGTKLLSAPLQLNIGFPSSVDVVYLYVNGSDPGYQRLRGEAWKHVTQMEENKHMTDVPNNGNKANSMALSSDSGELLFSLRSISKFLHGKVRKVFLVTESAPVWLNNQVLTSAELEVVHPRTIMPPGTYPNFNSRALESNLHKIAGLGDYYMTLNDDVYFGRPVSFDDFVSQGALKIHMDFSIRYNIDAANTLNEQSESWNSHKQAMKNSNRLLDLRFGHRSDREIISHSPLFFSKALVADAHSIFREALDNTSTHIFRSMFDVHPAFLYSHYMRENRSIMAEMEDSQEKLIIFPGEASSFCQMVSNGSEKLPRYFSVNNHMEEAENRIFNDWIRGGLHTLFPDPSKYEDVSLHHLDEPPPPSMLHELPDRLHHELHNGEPDPVRLGSQAASGGNSTGQSHPHTH